MLIQSFSGASNEVRLYKADGYELGVYSNMSIPPNGATVQYLDPENSNALTTSLVNTVVYDFSINPNCLVVIITLSA